jgi:glycosyltransferase involved in cell wall biosynthesis
VFFSVNKSFHFVPFFAGWLFPRFIREKKQLWRLVLSCVPPWFWSDSKQEKRKITTWPTHTFLLFFQDFSFNNFPYFLIIIALRWRLCLAVASLFCQHISFNDDVLLPQGVLYILYDGWKTTSLFKREYFIFFHEDLFGILSFLSCSCYLLCVALLSRTWYYIKNVLRHITWFRSWLHYIYNVNKIKHEPLELILLIRMWNCW